MGNFAYNRGKGRATEWAERVNANDPTNAVLVIMALDASGVESDATLTDKDSFADIVSGATNEATNSGYARKTIDNSGGLTITYNDTNDRTELDIPDPVWTGVTAGSDWSDIVFGYDPDSTGGADSAILPLSQHDFVVSPDSSDITGILGSTGFYHTT